MDDIQLCKDIMGLKQELRKIVAVPGKLTTTPLNPPRNPLPSLLSLGKSAGLDASKPDALSEVLRLNHAPSHTQIDSFKCTHLTVENSSSFPSPVTEERKYAELQLRIS